MIKNKKIFSAIKILVIAGILSFLSFFGVKNDKYTAETKDNDKFINNKITEKEENCVITNEEDTDFTYIGCNNFF